MLFTFSPSLRHQLPVEEASVEHGNGGEMLLATFADSAVSAAIPMEKKAQIREQSCGLEIARVTIHLAV